MLWEHSAKTTDLLKRLGGRVHRMPAEPGADIGDRASGAISQIGLGHRLADPLQDGDEVDRTGCPAGHRIGRLRQRRLHH